MSSARVVDPQARPSVPDVLRAVGRLSLLGLLLDEEARMLAGPVARAQAGQPFTVDEQRAAARLLQAASGTLGPSLAAAGVVIPPPPEPVATRKAPDPAVSAPVLWLLEGGWLAVRVPGELRELLEGLPGRERPRMTGYGPAWHFPATPAAAATVLAALRPYGPRASAGVLALAEQHTATGVARGVLDDGAPEPEYDGAGHVNMPLWAHQRRFVEFGMSAPAICFAVKMGGGKTGGAIALINRVQAGRVLIVCPNKVRRVWVREVRERSSVRWHIEDGTRLKKRGRGWIDLSHPERIAQANQVLFDCDCGAPVHAIALNYEAMELGVWQRWQPPAQLDLIAYDEAHKLKNRTDRIRRKVKGISKEELKRRAARDLPKWTRSGLSGQWRANTRRAIGLTGTPFPQHPWDIFGMYRALDPGIFGTVWTDFQEEWIEMDRSGTYPKRIKPDKLVEFAARCMSIMYVPKVDLHLPGCSDVLRTVELEPEARRVYDQLDTELWADLSRMLARQRGAQRRGGAGEVLDPGGDGELEDGGDGAPAELTARNILSRLLRLQQLTGGTLRTDPVEGRDGKPVPGPEVRVSTAKSDLLAEVLEDIGCVAAVKGSPQGYEPEPVIVFARFTSDLRAIREVVDAAGLRYGEISGRRVDGLNDDARMAGDRDVVGVQVQAGGTGIDLTRARYVVFYSLGYSVSDYDQARARPYRPGQTRPVVFIHIQAEDTQDEQVYAAIDQRRAAVSEVLRAGGVDPEEVGVIEADPGLAPEVLVDVDSAASAVVLPWEVDVEW